MNLGGKLEAALVKFLQGEVFPNYFANATAIHAGQSDVEIDGQFIRCVAAKQADEEYPLNSGNFWWPVDIELRTPFRLRTPAQTAAGDLTALQMHEAVAEVMDDAIEVDDLVAQITAAAAALGAGFELTCQGYDRREPASQEDPDVFSSGWTLRLLVCDSALAA